uniref:Glutathione-specific gamma-glutamylcyclotransferase 1 n=1 Tax=Cacopsylla melanoneura TaxID=428564 RepID=A0A8D8W1T5_9HEMI
MDSLDISSPEESSSIWVFGYGSLCWHPGFEFEKSTTGYVKGYSRKFWQGNDQHRGTSDSPGRVATLVQQPENIVWGRAFLVWVICRPLSQHEGRCVGRLHDIV